MPTAGMVRCWALAGSRGGSFYGSVLYCLWLNAEQQIASFHEVEGYRAMAFHVHKFFMDYLHTLQEQGYRFQ